MKRRWRDADVYLFFNEGAQASRHALTLMTKGSVAEAWDPQTGSVKPLEVTWSGGHPVIQLDLEPYATSVIVIH